MTVEAGTLNNVDLAAVDALVSAIQADTTWAAHVTWTGGFQSNARVRGFDPVPSDEPTGLGGGDTPPNPVEQLLSALGNCLAVGYAANAAVAGIQLDELTIDLKGDINLHVFLGLAEGHAGFDSITAKVTITSPAPRADLETLHAKVTASSPVGHALAAAAPVTVDLTRHHLLTSRRRPGAVRRTGATCGDGPCRWSGRGCVSTTSVEPASK